MESIAFVDSEIEPKTNRILDLGCIKSDGSTFHSNFIREFIAFIKGSKWICGHNVLNHDLQYLKASLNDAGISSNRIIDTLYLSALLYPHEPYHALLKDDKLQSEERNNPLNDAIKAKDLFYYEVSVFTQKAAALKEIFFKLLNDQAEFSAFFRFIDYPSSGDNVVSLIRTTFADQICMNVNLEKYTSEYPKELAYCLALIDCQEKYSITPPWILRTFPLVEPVMMDLRGRPCLSGCDYCNQALDAHKALKHFFGFRDFRTYGGEPLQEKAVQAAIENNSLLAVFPTGGGKSITFQLPALMAGENTKGLTVIISPLQSLMKDQVDNLERIGITEAEPLTDFLVLLSDRNLLNV